LLAAASDFRPELIVMGSRGLTKLKGLLLGGISHKMVQLRGRSCSDRPVPLAVEADGGPADAIMQVAARKSAIAVVIGRTSRTRLGQLLHGSVPRHIIDHSPAPVILA
jgi:nucleotide-binding universal stress UspA family protein